MSTNSDLRVRFAILRKELNVFSLEIILLKLRKKNPYKHKTTNQTLNAVTLKFVNNRIHIDTLIFFLTFCFIFMKKKLIDNGGPAPNPRFTHQEFAEITPPPFFFPPSNAKSNSGQTEHRWRHENREQLLGR